MTQVRNAGSKVNLFLEVTGRRDDGYHTLDTVFHRLEFGDILTIAPFPTPGLHFHCSRPELEKVYTTIHKAYDLVAQICGDRPGVRVDLQKNVPVGSGLGGGSADAACFLHYALETFPQIGALDSVAFNRAAASIGADVPVFLAPPLVHAQGIGDIITPLKASLDVGYLLVWPGVPVMTGPAFQFLDAQPSYPIRSSDDMRRDLALSNRITLFNRFESAAISLGIPVPEIKSRLIELGAWQAALTGSGSTVFGIFDSLDAARDAAERHGFPEHYVVTATRPAGT